MSDFKFGFLIGCIVGSLFVIFITIAADVAGKRANQRLIEELEIRQRFGQCEILKGKQND